MPVLSTRRGAGPCRAALAVLLLLLSALPAAAQARVDVSGRVIDAHTGLPIPSVTVHAGRVHATTGADGRFRLASVPAGAEVHLERLGYRPLSVPAEAASLDLSMVPRPVLLESVVVEAERGERLASNSALALRQVGQAEITATGATSLAETLDGNEGVSLSRVGSWGSRPALRGLSGERLAVLIDGNRVSRACTYGMDQGLATVDPATVERVEILTGPGSTAYGSGNVGGVINVVTRRPRTERPLSGEVRAHGSTAVPGGGLGGTLTAAGEDYAASLSLDGADFGDYETPEAEVATSGYRQLTADLTLEVEPSADQRLSFKGQRYEGRDIGWPMRGGAEIPEETRTSLSLDYGWQGGGSLVDGVSTRAYFQKLDHHMVMTMTMDGMGGMPMTSVTDGLSYSETSGGRVQLRLAPWAGGQVDVGTEVTHLLAEGTRWTERVMGSMEPVRETFHTWPGVRILDVGAFVQGDARLGERLTLSGGVRLDRVDREADQGDEKLEWVPTGNVGLRAAVASWLTARATVGVGYRTPDPMELYGLGLKPDGFLYRGRADLETETSLNREVSLTASGDQVVATVTGFHNRLRDMVTPVLAGDSVSGRPVREYRNLGEARIRGVSGTLQVGLPGSVRVEARATWTHGEDPETGAALPAIPPLEGGLTVARDFTGPVRWVEAEWRGADRQDRVAEAIGERVTPGWSVVNLRGNLRVAGTDLTLGVENLLDHLYRGHLDPYTLYRPGRNLFLRMSRAF